MLLNEKRGGEKEKSLFPLFSYGLRGGARAQWSSRAKEALYVLS
jgi:hypothetical protein